MWNGMKSVVQLNPMESKEQRTDKMLEWMNDNNRFKSSVADKAVPTARETREYLRKRGF